MSERMPTSRRSKYWIFTFNNYDEDSQRSMEHIFRDTNLVSYAVCGKEVGASGTPHLQGYIEWTTCLSLRAIKALGDPFASRIHMEARRGTRKQAITYCKKDGDFTEYGTPPLEDDVRRKLSPTEVKDIALRQGLRAVAQHPLATLHNIKTAQAMLDHIEPAIEEKPTVVWYYGETGIGKSYRAQYEAYEQFGKENTFRKAEGTKWFNGYDRHPAVIIDDYRDSWWPFTDLLSLLDRYPKRVEVKGGMRQWVPKKIWVTSSISPREMYKGVGEDIQQLIRRCDTITNIVFKWSPVDPDAPTVLCDERGRPLSRQSSNASIHNINED